MTWPTAALVLSLWPRGFDAIVHFAAESHVDRSISDATPFLRTNIVGTQCLLDAARAPGAPLRPGLDRRGLRHARPRRSAVHRDHAAGPQQPLRRQQGGGRSAGPRRAPHHGLNTVITRCSNNYGPYQFPEKLIPLFITNALTDIPCRSTATAARSATGSTSRDHCRGVDAACARGRAGEVYNFGGRASGTTSTSLRRCFGCWASPRASIRHVTDRPGHDRRYAIDPVKAETELNWRPHDRVRGRIWPPPSNGIARTAGWIESQESLERQRKHSRIEFLSGALLAYPSRLFPP